MTATCRYVCLEGLEGVGKSTQTEKLSEHLRKKGYRVLQSKEPGTPLSKLTMQLRGIMLDNQYDEELTVTARELISQAIRSIHLEKIIVPAMSEYDYIVQDRGILSGLAYGEACGNDPMWIAQLIKKITPPSLSRVIYDDVVYLIGDVDTGLQNAKASKQEFAAGDAIEKKGITFMKQVDANMKMYSSNFNTKEINIDGKNIDQVFQEILVNLDLENK